MSEPVINFATRLSPALHDKLMAKHKRDGTTIRTTLEAILIWYFENEYKQAPLNPSDVSPGVIS